MSRRSVTKKTVTTTTSSSGSKKNDQSLNDSLEINYELLKEDEFEQRPKTDYTYSRSATYSSKYTSDPVISPNLSRRRLYTGDLIRDTTAASGIRKVTEITTTTNAGGGNYRKYGSTSSRNTGSSHTAAASSTSSSAAGRSVSVSARRSVGDHNAINEAIRDETMKTRNKTYYSESEHQSIDLAEQEKIENAQRAQSTVTVTTKTTNQTTGSYADTGSGVNVTSHRNNSNNVISGSAQYSDDETDSVSMPRRRRSSSRVSSRQTQSASNIRRSTRLNQTQTNLGGGIYSHDNLLSSNADNVDRGDQYNITHGLDSDSELVTEHSTTKITTQTTGRSVAAKITGCFLFLYAAMTIFVKRLWWILGQPVYSTIQRYLLLDTWILSRGMMNKLRLLLLLLFLLCIPILLIPLTTCTLHTLGAVNVNYCARLTGIYYVNEQSDLSELNLSSRLQSMLTNIFTWSSNEHTYKPVTHSTPPNLHKTEHTGHQTPGGFSLADWESLVDHKLASLRSQLELNNNRELAMQRQKNVEFESNLKTISDEIEKMRMNVQLLQKSADELQDLRNAISVLSVKLSEIPDCTSTVEKLQKQLHLLQVKLGDVDLDQSEIDGGLLAYFYNEIAQIKSSIPNKPVKIEPICPDSTCVCESDLGLRLTRLQQQVRDEMEKLHDSSVYIGTMGGNQSTISENMVKMLIQQELDLFAEDRTGMVDFALQSMGAQVVSTRCSQTYTEKSSLLTFFGVPLYHLHNDPNIVIQPTVNPGECWCFYGQSGSLVIELAEDVQFESFSLEHISAKQSATGEISSAPRDFAIYGLSSEMDYEGVKIGNYKYDKTGRRIQFFPVQLDKTIPAFAFVELRVLSNWGKPEFTCLYRFRVHGRLARNAT